MPANRLESNTAASPQVQLNSARSFSNPDQVNTPSRTPSRNTPSPTRRTSPRRKPQTTRASQEEAAAPKHSPASPQPPRPVVTPHQFVEPELLYGACKYPGSVIKPLLCLTALDNSVREPSATSGERPISGRLAKCAHSLLWEGSADAYSGVKLAATLEAFGKTKCDPDRANG